MTATQGRTLTHNAGAERDDIGDINLFEVSDRSRRVPKTLFHQDLSLHDARACRIFRRWSAFCVS